MKKVLILLSIIVLLCFFYVGDAHAGGLIKSFSLKLSGGNGRYANLDDWKRGASFATWLFTIAKSLALNMQAKSSYRKEMPMDTMKVKVNGPVKSLSNKLERKNMKETVRSGGHCHVNTKRSCLHFRRQPRRIPGFSVLWMYSSGGYFRKGTTDLSVHRS